MIIVLLTKAETGDFYQCWVILIFLNLPIPMSKNGLKIGLVF
jgi:hypothetical protein